MNYSQFLQKQNKIYSEIASASEQLQKTGLISHLMEKNRDGYIINYRHSDAVSLKAHELSQIVSKIVPSYIYTPERIHTTISTFYGDFDQDLLNKLNHLLKAINNQQACYVNFDRYLINNDAIIAAGQPDEQFFNIADRIVALGAEMGLHLRYPHMAHITLARFSKDFRDNNKIQQLLKAVEYYPPLGISKIEIIEASYIKHHESGFEMIGRSIQKLK